MTGSKISDKENIKKYIRKKNGDATPPVVFMIIKITRVNIIDSRSLERFRNFFPAKSIMNRPAIIWRSY